MGEILPQGTVESRWHGEPPGTAGALTIWRKDVRQTRKGTATPFFLSQIQMRFAGMPVAKYSRLHKLYKL